MLLDEPWVKQEISHCAKTIEDSLGLEQGVIDRDLKIEVSNGNAPKRKENIIYVPEKIYSKTKKAGMPEEAVKAALMYVLVSEVIPGPTDNDLFLTDPDEHFWPYAWT